MINIKHLVMVSSAWVSIVYTLCYVGVVIYPPIRSLFMQYALHADSMVTADFLGAEYFASGLIIWNIVAITATGLFAYLYNIFKQ